MNYMTRRNNELSYFDPFFSDFFTSFDKESKLLKSDIKETNTDYIIDVEVPGLNKEDIKISLEDKYLTIKVSSKKENKESNVKYVHKEIFNGEATRSYYVGEVKEEDIKASFNNGILTITFTKEAYNNKVEKKYISIN